MDLITSLTSQAMNKALDGLAKRNTAIASNLANVDTPNYRRRSVSFEGALQQALHEANAQASAKLRPASNESPLAMKTTRPEHIPVGQMATSISDIQPEIAEMEDLSYRNDGNSVDVETEMVQLAKNTEKYLAISNLESRSIRSLKSVIQGGGS